MPDAGHDPWYQRYPYYYSTYCIHGLHRDCRLTCKHCPEKCQCECHGTSDGQAEP